MNRAESTAKAAPKPLSALREIVCHPLRINSLIVLTERKATVKELAQRLDADKGTVAHHVKKLLEAGAIEVIEIRKGRGPAESVYRAVQRPLVGDEESGEMQPAELTEWLERIFALIVTDTTASLQGGSFIERRDHNIIRYPTAVDEQGWKELTAIYAKALQDAMEVEAKSAGRQVKNRVPSIPVRVVSMVFEMPATQGENQSLEAGGPSDS